MRHSGRWIAALLATLALSAPLAGEDRLAVLELFGRTTCGNCQAAGRALTSLQEELGDRAVLLEYDWDAFKGSARPRRFLAVEPRPSLLPLVMVGSGFRTTSGPVSYSTVYRGMIDDELTRPPAATVRAFSRRSGDVLRVYVRATSTDSARLTTADRPTLWVIVWEDRPIGVSSAYVRAALPTSLEAPLPRGEPVTAVVDTPRLPGVDWRSVRSLALLERWVGEPAGGRYDTLQAAVARPAGLAVVPDRITLGRMRRRAPLCLDGPHVLSWTATPDVDWLRVDPPGGALPFSATVSLVDEVRPPGAATGTVRIEATGDGMSFTATVQVALTSTSPRTAGHRLVPSGR